MKKGFFAALIASSVLFASNLVSAYYFPSMRFASQDLVQTVVDLFQPILVALFGAYSYSYVFEVFLIFLILAGVVYIAAGRIPMFKDKDQKAVRWIITIVVPLLGVRFIDFALLIAIFQSYQLLAIVLTSVLPFILYFYFLYEAAGDYGIIRKLGWALWIAVYFGLYSSAYINDMTSAVYFWTMVVGLSCLAFDTTINRRMRLMRLLKTEEAFKERQIGNLRMQIASLNEQMAKGALSQKFGRESIREIESQIRELRKL